MTKVVMAADVRDESSTKLLALSTYAAFLKAGIDVSFLKVGDQIKALEAAKLPSINVNEIKNSIIIAFREINAFINIDRTNTVVYLATTGRLDSFMTYMIHRVDHVITPDYKTAFHMVSSLRQMGLSTPIHRITPWLEEGGRSELGTELKILANGPETLIRAIKGHNVTYIGESNLDEWKTTITPKLDEYNVYIHMGVNDDFKVREAMMAGLVPIVQNAIPYTEFVLNGVNGFLCTTADELVAAVNALKDNNTRSFYRVAAMRTGCAVMSAEAWSNLFIRTVHGLGAENLNIDGILDVIEPSYRRWLVPKMILQGGRKVMVPRQFNENRFKVVELATVKEILTYFSMQKFMDVFIFGWEYNPISEKDTILNLVRAIGRRGLNMYWCTDDPIPKEWEDIFRTMTILPTQEGLKKVKPLASHLSHAQK